MSDPQAPRRPRSAAAIAFYTQCRNWHGYLSAFAFLSLIFFSASGILLNHPEWLSEEEKEARTASATLAAADIRAAKAASDAGAALGALAAKKLPLMGVYASGDVDTAQAFLRYEGVKGSSDVTLNLKSGVANARIHPADALTVMDDLHRGKNVGKAWRALIDFSGALFLVLSLIGYVLFFTLRFKLRTALVLTAASLGALVAIFVLFVP